MQIPALNKPTSVGPVLLADVLDIELLERHIANRFVHPAPHPQLPYRVLDYTKSAQFAGVFDSVIKTCRGLIVSGDPLDLATTVVARPFAKFANVGEHSETSPFGVLPVGRPFEVFDKLDGSLAISYADPDGRPAFSTRGSFTSDQAQAATALWNAQYADYPLTAGATMLFEFIAPWNRIVVSYGDLTDLVLLAVIDNATGADLVLPADWPGHTVKRRPFDAFDDVLDYVASSPATNEEGFVIRFAPDAQNVPSVRAKCKLAEYVRLHKVATGLTSRIVYQHLRASGNVDALIEIVPDEGYEFIKQTEARLRAEYDAIYNEAAAIKDALPTDMPRKEMAAWLYKNHDRKTAGLVFSILDGYDVQEAIWRRLEPPAGELFQMGAIFTNGD